MHIRIELYEQIALTDKLLTFPGAHTTLCHLLVLIFCFTEGNVVDK